MQIRLQTEARERATLSPRASLSAESRGRAFPEEPCPIRTCFARDRDRVIHCKSFRRLKHKTQVFLAISDDHYRTRLTHTLEVSQIARTISRALALNEDLTEAIALAHDLGHTPFGHSGEQALDRVIRQCDPSLCFRHVEQSVRVIDVLERDGRGLNLTWEVRNGVASHSKGRGDIVSDNLPATLEGQVVRIADRLAYLHHDTQDAIRAGMLSAEDLPAVVVSSLGKSSGERLTRLITDLIESSRVSDAIRMSETASSALDVLKDFLFERVYNRESEKMGNLDIDRIVADLFERSRTDPTSVPQWITDVANREHSDPARASITAATDYVAGMTDRYAIAMWESITGRQVEWSLP